MIFGEGEADTSFGGEGDDPLFSGSGTVHFADTFNHYPGDLTKAGDDSDVLPGDKSAVSIAFHDNYSADEDQWRNAAGNPITSEQGAAASVILPVQQDQSILGTNYDASPA